MGQQKCLKDACTLKNLAEKSPTIITEVKVIQNWLNVFGCFGNCTLQNFIMVMSFMRMDAFVCVPVCQLICLAVWMPLKLEVPNLVDLMDATCTIFHVIDQL